MISIITICNDRMLLEGYLLKSLKEQTAKYELLIIDNVGNKQFSHATKALNYGASLAKGDYLLFIHQDVALLGNKFLEKFEEMLDKIDDVGVGGVSGVTQCEKPYLFIKVDNALYGTPFPRPVVVQTLDEMLLTVPKHVFNKASFDDNLPGWHCYGADYCLEIKKLGLSAYVLPFFVHHESPGVTPKEIMRSLFYMRNKWHTDIYHGSWSITEGGDIVLKYMNNPLQYSLIREILDYLLGPLISKKTLLFYYPLDNAEYSMLPLQFDIGKLNIYDRHQYPITVLLASPDELSQLVKMKYNIAYVIPSKQDRNLPRAVNAIRPFANRIMIKRRHTNLPRLYFWRLFS